MTEFERLTEDVNDAFNAYAVAKEDFNKSDNDAKLKAIMQRKLTAYEHAWSVFEGYTPNTTA